MTPEQQAFFDAVLKVERDRQRRTEVVNYQPTLADAAQMPSNAIRGLLDTMAGGDDSISEALRYYLGPTGLPDRLAAMTGLLDPGVYEGGYAAADLMDPRTAPADRQMAAQRFGMTAALAPLAFMRPARSFFGR
jgi:hypothetical protein